MSLCCYDKLIMIPSYHKASLELGPHYIQISCYSSPFSFYCIKACTITHTHQSHSDEYFIYKNQFSLREMDGDLFDAPCVYVIVNSKVSYNATCWWCASPRQHPYTSVLHDVKCISQSGTIPIDV